MSFDGVTPATVSEFVSMNGWTIAVFLSAPATLIVAF